VHGFAVSSHLRRILETLGIERKPRDVTPSLEAYVAEFNAKKSSGGAP
jgi:hypothetical protein